MGAVTVSGSSSQTPFASFSSRRSPSLRRPFSALSLKPSHSRFSAFLAPEEPATTISPPDTIKKPLKKRLAKAPKRVNAVISPAAGVTDLDYNQIAVALENLYKLSPELDEETLEKIYKIGITEVEEEESEVQVGRRGRGRKRVQESEEDTEVVRNRSRRRARRPDLERRVAMRKLRKEKASEGGGEEKVENEEEDVEKLVREYSASADLVSWDWKKMKIPRVLSSTEQARLFRLMQPMKRSIIE